VPIQLAHPSYRQVRIAALEASLASEHALSGRLQQQVSKSKCCITVLCMAWLIKCGIPFQTKTPACKVFLSLLQFVKLF
jgi:hypothetical protein